MSARERHTTAFPEPTVERTEFVRDNAEALLADRDGLIERQRSRITQLEQAVFSLKKERRRAERRIADLEHQLRETRSNPPNRALTAHSPSETP